MQINVQQLGKRYRYEWIFRQIDYIFEPSKKYAVTGTNGSGKSTLMRIFSGHLSPTKGKIEFVIHGKPLSKDGVYRYIAYAAPYIELIEELTFVELLRFHQRFKPFMASTSIDDLIDLSGLEKSTHKEVRYFSSGMKQRVKLLLAICTDAPLLLLDEPTTNLDQQGMIWYHQLVEQFMAGRTIIVASNVEEDFSFCENRISILDYKQTKTKIAKDERPHPKD